MIVEGRALLIAMDDVDTDVLYPGQFLNVFDPAETVKYLFEGLDPSLRDQLTDDTILFAWANFGTGSSRENVPEAMKAAGIRCVVAKSFARIFHRNCINLGLPAIACPEAAAAARTGSSIRVDTEGGTIEVDGVTFPAPPLPPFMRELLGAGGLVPWIARRGTRRAADGEAGREVPRPRKERIALRAADGEAGREAPRPARAAQSRPDEAAREAEREAPRPARAAQSRPDEAAREEQ